MNTSNLTAARLRSDFDINRLLAELALLERANWAAQRTYGENLEPTADSRPHWRVLALRSPGGRVDRTDPGGLSLLEYEDTRWMANVPYIKSILAGLPTELQAVRLMSLDPGGEVNEHRDEPYGLPAGWVRLHIPLITNEDAICMLDGQLHTWQPATFWFGDFSRPHSVRNGGSERRVHLVIDAYVTLELLELFSADFRRQIRLADVLLYRPEVSLTTGELDEFQSTFMVPDAFLYGGEPDDMSRVTQPDHAARLRIADGRLLMEVEGEPRFGLVHLGEGEFRGLGWTAERTLKVEPGDKELRIRFRMRYGRRMEEVTRQAVPTTPTAPKSLPS